MFEKNLFSRTLRRVKNWSIRLAICGGLGSGAIEDLYGEAARRIRSEEIKTLQKLQSFMRDNLPSDEDFRAAFATARMRNPKQTRHMLVALEKQARLDAQLGQELEPNLDESRVNLQHILPRNADESDWDAFTFDERQLFERRFGNVALLSANENRKAGNKPFREVKSIYAESDFLLTQQVANRDDWDPQSISARQEALAKLAVRTWPL